MEENNNCFGRCLWSFMAGDRWCKSVHNHVLSLHCIYSLPISVVGFRWINFGGMEHTSKFQAIDRHKESEKENETIHPGDIETESKRWMCTWYNYKSAEHLPHVWFISLNRFRSVVLVATNLRLNHCFAPSDEEYIVYTICETWLRKQIARHGTARNAVTTINNAKWVLYLSSLSFSISPHFVLIVD